jgi:hypothetical protein
MASLVVLKSCFGESVFFDDFSSPSLGEYTNPLIRFDPIKGLAVGFVIAYRMMRTRRIVQASKSRTTFPQSPDMAS